ncbi:hypothetical protein [Duganella sp. Root1480D1]|uniref:hypothetical protein n=1 Tax=Duganella sp. Root1480D1 TaxID=1736471 RepID=UPI00070C720E|nr:hypothetical protein [Duganella sp. Root1480D1]KQZ44024.1 hypothetical protein ASD58_19995 [Duganella sp. Root1480D1]
MEYFKSVSDLIAGLKKLEQEAWIYTNMQSWLSNPQKADFYYLPWDYMQSLEDDEVYENDDGAELPLDLKDKNLKEWMIVNVLVHIAKSVDWRAEGMKEFIEQVNYYREFDTFKR